MVAGLLAVGTTAGAAGQVLSIKDRPSAESLACQPLEEMVCRPSNRAEVDSLVNEATRTLILGALDDAARDLDRALELDPCAAEAAYLRARIVAQEEGPVAAAPWFCRYVGLAPFGASASEARARLDQAVRDGAGADLLDAFTEAVAWYREGELEQAEQGFTAVLDRRALPEAVFNRGVVRMALGRQGRAREDLIRYLELRPRSEDRLDVEYALLELDEGSSGGNPGAALALGLLLPGAGQYYTGRVGFGLVVTGLVAGAIATGYLYEETTIWCRVPSPSGECPPDAVAMSETERPLLVPAVAVSIGVVLASAIEATLHARGSQAPPSLRVGDAGTLRLDLAVRPVPGDAAEIQLLRFLH